MLLPEVLLLAVVLMGLAEVAAVAMVQLKRQDQNSSSQGFLLTGGSVSRDSCSRMAHLVEIPAHTWLC